MISVFLPKNYPHSVSTNYINYCKWQALQYIAGSFSGVLTMQSLLHAAGITSQLAASATGNEFFLAFLGGALAWVIKDGLGQLGGILFASKVNTNFDADPKMWRMRGEYALVTSALLEVTTPITGPSWFIAQASLANIGKNVSCFAASATRAAMNQSFAKSDNLADVTAKATSQALACSLIGTTLGIFVSSALSLGTQFVFAKIFPLFCLLSVIQLFSLYKAVSNVKLKVLNKQRFLIACSQYLTSDNKVILNPSKVSEREKFVLPFLDDYQKRVKINTNIKQIEDLVGENHYRELITNRFTIVHDLKHHQHVFHVLFEEKAQTMDVFKSMLIVTKLLNGHVILDHQSSLDSELDTFMLLMKEQGWSIDHDFVEDNSHMRIAIKNSE